MLIRDPQTVEDIERAIRNQHDPIVPRIPHFTGGKHR